MYKILIHEGSNIPLLTNDISDDDSIYSLRPVYHEELDILGFNKHWNYPNCQEPLLWASGRRYYYKGIFVAETIGGDLFTPPVINIIHSGSLKPVNVEQLIENNLSKLEILENEAKLFISKAFKKHREKSLVTLSYSGGKDSEAILDLTMQVIPPEDVIIVYNDTGMEMPYVTEAVQTLKKSFHDRKIPVQFITSFAKTNIETLWRQFGPPTRTHRWCCTVCKTAPLWDELITYKREKTRVMNIVGIRAEESSARKEYDRFNEIGKHSGMSSVHPIFHWNSLEVYLYLMYKGHAINNGYRNGLLRVGCSVCPFSTPLSEYINYNLYPEKMTSLLQIIRESLQLNGVQNNELNDYIKDKNWAKVVRSQSLTHYQKKYSIKIQDNEWTLFTNLPKDDLIFGLSILDKFDYYESNITAYVEFAYKGDMIRGIIAQENGDLSLKIKHMNNNQSLTSLLKRILNKLCYCVSCGACEVDCPTNAISMKNRQLNKDLCIHCLKCVNAYDNGCLNANFRINLRGDSKMESLGALNRYWGFGIRQEWLDHFINNPEEWLRDNGLGEFQFKAMKNWLRDGEFLDSNINLTELYKLLKSTSANELITLILWLNLVGNSSICAWFTKLEDGHYEKSELEEMLYEDFPTIANQSRNNALLSLLGTLRQTHIGKHYGLCSIDMKGNSVKAIEKRKITNMPNAALIYSLFKYTEKTGNYNTTLEHVTAINTNTNSLRGLGIEVNELKKLLLGLQEHKSRLLRVEFNANLDNIFLNKDHTALSALKAYLED